MPEAQIAVERIRGPVLTVAAGEDAPVWDSTTSASEVQQRLTTARFHFPHRALTYDQAGHDVGAAIPYLPQPADQGALRWQRPRQRRGEGRPVAAHPALLRLREQAST